MRTLLQIVMPVESGNKAIKDEVLGHVLDKVFSDIKPEATYFLAVRGKRSCIAVFDLKSTADIPVIAEPLFTALNCELEFTPVMNAEELKQGLSRLK